MTVERIAAALVTLFLGLGTAGLVYRFITLYVESPQ